MVTLVLAVTVIAAASSGVPFPIEMTALVMVGLILRVYIVRENKSREEHAKRLKALEEEVDEQRHLKHLVINQLAGITGTLSLVQAAASRCTCGAVAPVLPLIENLLAKEAGDASGRAG